TAAATSTTDTTTIPATRRARSDISDRSIPLPRPGRPATPPLHLHQTGRFRCRVPAVRPRLHSISIRPVDCVAASRPSGHASTPSPSPLPERVPESADGLDETGLDPVDLLAQVADAGLDHA